MRATFRRIAPSRTTPVGRALLFLVRATAVLSMAFGAAFGFLTAMGSPGSHYDPHAFAIGTAALFGAACGAIGILICARPHAARRTARAATAHRRTARPKLGTARERGTRPQLPRSAGRRHRAHEQRRCGDLRQRCLLRARRLRSRRARRRRPRSAGDRTASRDGAGGRQPQPRPEDRHRERRPLDCLARRRRYVPKERPKCRASDGMSPTASKPNRRCRRRATRRKRRTGRSRAFWR